MLEQWTADAVPDQHGRVAVITGADSGVGFEVAKVLASKGALVILTAVDAAKGIEAAERITTAVPHAELAVQCLDLSSLTSIQSASRELKARIGHIDLLINSAEVMQTSHQTTQDGFELHLGVNHLGHFAFTGLLLETLMHVPKSRVISVSDLEHKSRNLFDFEDLQCQRSFDWAAAYGQSKLANLLFSYELQHRLSEASAATIAVAAHPGNWRTAVGPSRNLPARELNTAFDRFFTQSAENGALPILRAATDPRVKGGQYYGPDGFHELKGYPIQVASSEESHNREAQRRLWNISVALTGVTYPIGNDVTKHTITL